MAAEDIVIQIDLESRDAQKKLKEFNKELGITTKETGKLDKEIQNGSKSFSDIAKFGAAAAVGVIAVGKAFSFAVDAAIKIEDLTTQFIAFTGSAESAEKQLEALAAFSAGTPFQLEELAEANKTLLAFGSSTDESLEQLRQLGEVASATGKDIGELSTIFGQIQATGKLTGERFNQLVERGVNIGPTLAKSLGVAESSLESLRSAGKITSDDVAEAFRIMTSEGGQFFGSTERQSKTLSGVLSTFSDNVTLLAANIGSKLTPTIVQYVDGATAALQVTNDFINSLSQAEEIDETSRQIINLEEQLRALVEKRDEIKSNGTSILDSIFVGNEAEILARNEAHIIRVTNAIKELQNTRSQRSAQGQFEEQIAKEVEAQAKANEELGKLRLAQDQFETEIAEAKKLKIDEINKQITEAELRELANRQALLAAKEVENNQVAIDLLVERDQQLRSKTAELEAQKLEIQGQFAEAAAIQAVTLETIKQEQLTEATRKGEQERLRIIKEAQDEEFDVKKQTSNAQVKFEEQTYAQNVQTAQKGLSAIANLQKSGSKEAFEVGKAASIAQALIAIPTTAIEAYKSLAGIPVVGPGLGATAAAAAVAAGLAQVNKIRSTTFTAFADGGVVPGTGNRDTVPALLTPGEVVVPQQDFKDLKSGFDNRIDIEPTNQILEELLRVQERALAQEQARALEQARLQRFESSTPGGVFYEPVESVLELDAHGQDIAARLEKISADRRAGGRGRVGKDRNDPSRQRLER